MEKIKVIYMGTPDFAVPIFQKLTSLTEVVLVVTQPDKIVGRKRVLTPPPVKVAAEKLNIPVFQPSNIKKDYQLITDTSCDLIVTCAYGQIIPPEVLNYPRLGCINVHASLLPKYRGGAPIHWALINGEEKTGVTIMMMDEGMDSGDIISQKKYLIKPTDNVSTLHNELSLLGSSLLEETLPSIISQTAQHIRQDDSLVTYAYNITRADEHLDFTKDGKSVINKIRGLNSWPLANTLINGEEVKIIEATFVRKEGLIPNQIVEVSKTKLGISCLDGIIYVQKLKPFGKKTMDINSFLNGVDKEKLKKSSIS